MGSILERSATLIVRRFWLFLGTACVLLFIPLAIGEFIIGQVMSGSAIGAMLHALQRPGATYAFDFLSFRQLALGESVIGLAGVLSVFVTSAIAVNVVAVLGGGVAGFRDALRRALARWPQLFGILVIAFFIGIGAMALMFGIFVTLVGTIAALYKSGLHSAFVLSIFVTAALIIVLAVFLLLVLNGVALTMAWFSTVVERRGVASALGSGYERVFSRDEWKRAFGAAIIGLLFGFVVQIAAYPLQAVTFLLGAHNVIVLAVAAAVNALVLCFAIAVEAIPYAVYYSDRLGRERAAESSA